MKEVLRFLVGLMLVTLISFAISLCIIYWPTLNQAITYFMYSAVIALLGLICYAIGLHILP